MKIAFHTNQLSLRGTEVSMFDYAKYNEELLGNKSIVISKHPDIQKYSDELAIDKFKSRFDVKFYKTIDELKSIIKEEGCDVFYAQKAGAIDDVKSDSCKNVVHAVFQYNEPHGDVYAYISEWLSRVFGSYHPFVPYMVDLPHEDGDLRNELGIPREATVYGRHGGLETFDIGFVQNTIIKMAQINPNVYFVFMNTNKFGDDLPNVIFIDGTQDMIRKTKFINTCDAMIHARMAGESFGLAIAEFSIKNKPVLTCKHSRDNAHIMMLGDKGRYYQDETSLMNLFKGSWKKDNDWNAYGEYTPQNVMKKFNEVFLK